MPCWKVNRISIAFKAGNIDLLKKAMESMKYPYKEVTKGRFSFWFMDIDTNDGTVEVFPGDEWKLKRLKQEYSYQVVKEAARKKKWFVKNAGENKFQVRRS